MKNLLDIEIIGVAVSIKEENVVNIYQIGDDLPGKWEKVAELREVILGHTLLTKSTHKQFQSWIGHIITLFLQDLMTEVFLFGNSMKKEENGLLN